MAETWYLLRSGAGLPAFNMALDEAVMEAGPRLGRPLLRFYGWSEVAATFGYFQQYHAVERMTALRPLIRRPTGGGLVPHDADWTYSLIFPPDHPWYALRATSSYRRLHEWVRKALETLSLDVELSAAARQGERGQCFAGAEECDVLWRGGKIAGAAQRRARSGLLIQGSVRPPPLDLSRDDWERAFAAAAAASWDVRWMPFEADAELTRRVDELARDKYLQAHYNERR